MTVLSYSWLLIILVALWWFASAASTNVFIPSLQRIVEILARDIGNGILVWQTGVSLYNLGVGLLIAAAIGIIGGIVLGENEAARTVLDPLIHFVRSVPQVALVPLIIGTLGIGAWPKILAIAIATVWPILLNTIDGVRAVDPTVQSMSKTYRIPRSLHFRRVVLPSALPQIMAGIRVSLGIGVTVMVVTELFGSDKGLGFYILNSAATFRIPETWAGALLVGVIGYLLTLVLIAVERMTLKWYYASGAE